MDYQLYKIKLYRDIFFTSTLVLILLSVYPGNLIGLIIFGDDSTLPGSDKFHHFISYFFVSFFGFLSFSKKGKLLKILFFLLGLGLFLELFQIWIPNRYFELLDIFFNIGGVVISLAIFKFLKFKEK